MRAHPGHPLARPCRARRPDGETVVVFAGWALLDGWPHEMIAAPTDDEVCEATEHAVARKRAGG